MDEVSRRSVAKGTAWAVPVIALGASAPAVAASPGQPSINRSFLVTRSQGCSVNGGTGGSLTVVSSNDGSSYYQIVNATSSTKVTQVMASVLVTVPGLNFSTTTGNWGPVYQDSQTYSDGTSSRVYYRYYSTLAVAVPAASNGVITIPRLSWSSVCAAGLASTVWANGRGTVTINGTQQVQVGGFRSV